MKTMIFSILLLMVACSTKQNERKIPTCSVVLVDFLSTAHTAGGDEHGWFIKPDNGIVYTWIKRLIAVDYLKITKDTTWTYNKYKPKSKCQGVDAVYNVFKLTLIKD